MAQLRTVILVDDLDGSQAQHTVAFSLDGEQYEIDLSAQNTERLHDLLAPFVAKARMASAGPKMRRQAHHPRTAARPQPQEVAAPADVTTPEEETAVAPKEAAVASSRPPVPAALFSDTTEHVASRAVAALKPQATELFSPAS